MMISFCLATHRGEAISDDPPPARNRNEPGAFEHDVGTNDSSRIGAVQYRSNVAVAHAQAEGDENDDQAR
jgi:hypothetical protein